MPKPGAHIAKDDDKTSLDDVAGDGESEGEDEEDGCIRTRIFPSSDGEASNEISRSPSPAGAPSTNSNLRPLVVDEMVLVICPWSSTSKSIMALLLGLRDQSQSLGIRVLKSKADDEVEKVEAPVMGSEKVVCSADFVGIESNVGKAHSRTCLPVIKQHGSSDRYHWVHTISPKLAPDLCGD
jgi:hypothetical protein